MKQSIRLTRVANGYTMRANEVLDDGTEVRTLYVFEEGQEEGAELMCMQDILQSIMEYFGIHYSEHAEVNLIVALKETNDERIL